MATTAVTTIVSMANTALPTIVTTATIAVTTIVTMATTRTFFNPHILPKLGRHAAQRGVAEFVLYEVQVVAFTLENLEKERE